MARDENERVLAASLPAKLSAGAGYGRRHRVRLEGRPIDVLPLAHPATPEAYQEAHQRWRQAT